MKTGDFNNSLKAKTNEMYFVFILVIYYGIFDLTLADKGWPCKTPENEDGRCVPLMSCLPLFKAFANPSKQEEAYLKKFICTDDDPVVVCCNSSTNVTNGDVGNEQEKLENFEYCGLQRSQSELNLNTTLDEFPWLAWIKVDYSTTEKYLLFGGTLINARYVITTGIKKSTVENPATIITVGLGDYDITTKDDCVFSRNNYRECSTYDIYGVEEKIIHPFFSIEANINSLLLLRLNRTVTYTNYIRPICLPLRGTKVPKLNDYFYISGWGYILNTSQRAVTKKKIITKLISKEECLNSMKSKSTVTDYHMCTVDLPTNEDFTCTFDQGGPLMFFDNGRYYLEGVVNHVNCENSVPNVHRKISKYIRWIVENMQPKPYTEEIP